MTTKYFLPCGDPKPGAYSIAQWCGVGVQAIEQIHLKQTTNFHCKQWRLTFDGSVSFRWVQTRPEICSAMDYAPEELVRSELQKDPQLASNNLSNGVDIITT